MLRIPITRVPLTAEQSLQTLKERGILTNRYAEMYIRTHASLPEDRER